MAKQQTGLNDCKLCGGEARFNHGNSYHFIGGPKTKMFSCAAKCKKCGTKMPRGEWFDDPDGAEKAKKDARKRWNKLHKR